MTRSERNQTEQGVEVIRRMPFRKICQTPDVPPSGHILICASEFDNT